MTDRLTARDTDNDLGAPGVHLVETEKADGIVSALSGAGWRISPINGGDLTTEADAVSAIAGALNLGDCHDSDDLEGALPKLKLYPASEGALLVWNDADALISADADGFATIVRTLDDAAGQDSAVEVPFEVIVKVADPDAINL